MAAQPNGPEPPGKEALEAVLPPGEQSNVILAKCTVCHGPEVTMRRMQSRIGLSASGWKKLLTRMKSYGAPLAEDEMQQLSVYLSADFGSSSAPAQALPIQEFYSFLPEGSGQGLGRSRLSVMPCGVRAPETHGGSSQGGLVLLGGCGAPHEKAVGGALGGRGSGPRD